MKEKSTAVDPKPPFTSVKRDAENFPRNENIKLQLACELGELGLYFEGVAKSHARAARVR